MFVVLELAERKNRGIISSVLNMLTRSKAGLIEASAFGARYLQLTAPARDGLPDWDEVAELSGRLSKRMVMPDGLTPPPDSPIRPLACPNYEKRVLLETACELVKRTRMPMYRRSLGLIDPDGLHADLLFELLKHYTSVRVVTRSIDTYRQAADDMMERLGAPVRMGSSLSILDGCVLILAPGAAFGEGGGKYPCPVLAGSVFTPAVHCGLITGLRPPVSAELRGQCPPGIEPHRFAAALYEDQGVETGGYIARRVLYDYRETGLDDAVKEVMRASGSHTP